MIIVTGHKRSGTSLMMQMLDKAGFITIGEKFPEAWDKKMYGKNKEGFFESKFIDQGVNNSTSPFTHRDDTELSAVKVFTPGLLKTDFHYITKVIVMVRDWREQVESLKKLYKVSSDGVNKYPDGYEYFFAYKNFLDDFLKRGYETCIIDYNDLLQNPEENCERLKSFFGVGRWDLAKNQVKDKLNTVKDKVAKSGNHKLNPDVEDSFAEMLDKLYNAIKSGTIDEPMQEQILAWAQSLKPTVDKINEEYTAKKLAESAK